MPQYGIHANGWQLKKSEYIFHFAIRSKKIKHFPGLYDNIFAGGQPSGISIKKNLKKEALEKQASRVSPKKLTKGSTISYCHSFKKSNSFRNNIRL